MHLGRLLTFDSQLASWPEQAAGPALVAFLLEICLLERHAACLLLQRGECQGQIWCMPSASNALAFLHGVGASWSRWQYCRRLRGKVLIHGKGKQMENVIVATLSAVLEW